MDVFVTPRVRSQLLGLERSYLRVAEGMLRTLQAGDRPVHTCKIKGYERWSRSRDRRVRLLWSQASDESVVVGFVGLRDERTYAGLKHKTRVADLDLWEEDAEEAVEFEDETETCRLDADVLPGYRWDPLRWDLEAFLEGEYVAHVRLTPDQRDVLGQLPKGRDHEGCVVLVQGGAGTGKTVGALLSAADEPGRVLFVAPAGVQAVLDRYRASHDEKARNVVFRTPEDFWEEAVPEMRYDLDEAFGALEVVVPPDLRSVLRPYDALQIERTTGSVRDAFDEPRPRWMVAKVRDAWKRELQRRGVVTRMERCSALRADAPVLDGVALVVVDEVQDWMQEEILRLRDVMPGSVPLWLFGDVNQRLSRSGFWPDGLAGAWPDGRLTRLALKNNHRNHANVLRAAAALFRGADAFVKQAKGRHLPPPCRAEDASQSGGVGVWARLTPQLRGRLDDRRGEGGTLLEMMRSSIPLLTSQPARMTDLMGGRFAVVDAHKVKGMEYEACLVVHPFPSGAAAGSLEDVFHAYVLMTRARSSVVVLVDEEEVTAWERAGLLDGWSEVGEAEAMQHIVSMRGYGSVIDYEAQAEDLAVRLLEGMPGGIPFADTRTHLLQVEVHRPGLQAEWERAWHLRLAAQPMGSAPSTPDGAWLLLQHAMARGASVTASEVDLAVRALEDLDPGERDIFRERLLNVAAPDRGTLTSRLLRGRLAQRLGLADEDATGVLADTSLEQPLGSVLATRLLRRTGLFSFD